MLSTYIRPPIHTMSLHLYRRGLHPELYETCIQRVVARDDYTLTVQITPTGHVLTWQTESICLTEVTAPYGHALPKRGHVWRHRFGAEQSDAFRASAGIRYLMSAQTEQLSREHFHTVHHELLADSRKRGVSHVFTTHDDQGLSPLGLVTADARAGCLLINTFHTFPSEWALLKTQTLIERVD